jgi:hypothetical protein
MAIVNRRQILLRGKWFLLVRSINDKGLLTGILQWFYARAGANASRRSQKQRSLLPPHLPMTDKLADDNPQMANVSGFTH